MDSRADDALELLGLVAYVELATFGRFTADAVHAPTLRERQALSRSAGEVLARQERVLGRIEEVGADPLGRMGAFDGVLDDFDARTVPSTWWEGILKGYVGYGVAVDFCRLAADGLDDPDRDLVAGVLAVGERVERSATVIAEAAASDPVLASRLALWGRRLVGEALGVVQRLLAERGAFARLVARTAHDVPDDRRQAWVFAQLTAEHTRRMGRLGLAA